MGKIATPAEYVIRIFGGVRATARTLGIDPMAVSRWKKPNFEHGADGRIPSKHQAVLLKHAASKGLDLTCEDLILGRYIEL